MADALIYAGLRTAVGAFGGALSTVRTDDLAAVPIKAVVEKAGVTPQEIDDVIYGCANGSGEDNRNVARMASLLAGLPVEVPGMTINRLCGSGLQSVACAAQAIKAGEGDLFVAGGIESMSRSPYVMLKAEKGFDRNPQIADTTVGWRFVNKKMNPEWTISLGATAEVVGERYEVTREEQDAFAFESQRRAAAAIEEGVFKDEIVSVFVPQRKADPIEFKVDEHPRQVSLEKLARLRPAFKKDGKVTAGSSSGINDGSAALIVGAEGRLDKKPLARVIGTAVAGLDPSCMGLGPVPATRKVLKRAGLTLDDVDLIELNEAFAAQSLGCIKELGLDMNKTNVYGGGIALGHPLGATGAKLLVTLIHALHRREKKIGLVTMCIGVGQGIAMLVERV